MPSPPPQPAADAAAASWLRDRIGVTDAHWVTNTVGTGFAAYARIFHPLGDEPDAKRWPDVAGENGRVMHASAAWENISSPLGRTAPDNPIRGGYQGSPDWGDLRPVFLAPLCDLLARHTTMPDRVWFAVWEGWGWWSPANPASFTRATRGGGPPPPIEYAPDSWQLDPHAPRFDLPFGRTYLLYEGAVHEALRFGWWNTASWFEPQSPSLFWPDDHAWCVATEIDFDSTLVGGSPALVDAITTSSSLDALPIRPNASREDEINI